MHETSDAHGYQERLDVLGHCPRVEHRHCCVNQSIHTCINEENQSIHTYINEEKGNEERLHLLCHCPGGKHRNS